MRLLTWTNRCAKEILRDPLSLIFTLGLPLVLLVLFAQIEIPGDVYRLENFTPGIIGFSLAFVSMFVASLVAKDRCSAFLTRLAVSPLTGFDFLCGYALATLPLVLAQNLLFFTAALLLGLDLTLGILLTVLASIALSPLFIGMGILIGSLTNEKSAGGVSSVVVQLFAFTSGMYFDASMIGQALAVVCDILPFSGSVAILKTALNGGSDLLFPILTVLIWTIGIWCGAMLLFRRRLQE